jgi:hypothetical protein
LEVLVPLRPGDLDGHLVSLDFPSPGIAQPADLRLDGITARDVPGQFGPARLPDGHAIDRIWRVGTVTAAVEQLL